MKTEKNKKSMRICITCPVTPVSVPMNETMFFSYTKILVDQGKIILTLIIQVSKKGSNLPLFQLNHMEFFHTSN